MLSRKFYQRNTLKVAQDLLGCFLVRKIGNKAVKAMIMETEAYMGEDDLASHASKGRTPRTELMFGEAGKAYIYMIYGMYHCLNIITEKKDFPAAVLIRSVKIIKDSPFKKGRCPKDRGICKKIKISPSPSLEKRESIELNGPGKLCKFLEIDRKLNGHDITHVPKQSLVRGKRQEDKLWIEKGIKIKPSHIKKGRRIGVDYAKHCKEYLWRFTLNL